VAYASGVVGQTLPVDFRLVRAAATRDPLTTSNPVFLLPADGADRMHDLHARLHSGVRTKRRHPTVPFQPHVTVGTLDYHEDAQSLACRLMPFAICGALERRHIARFDGRALPEGCQLKFHPPPSAT
jgi:hypothetical protein